jgi:acetyl-CoA carboxylase biotin carboxyl carrier protein
MSIDHQDVQEILAIIDKTPAKEVIVEHGELKVIVRRGDCGGAAPVPEAPDPVPVAPAAVPEAAATEAEAARAPPSSTAIAVEAPLTGTFYQAPAPGAEPFVSEGVEVDEMTTLCILEVMKVMNTLKAPCAGSIARIDAANEQSVTAGQALIWIEPG